MNIAVIGGTGYIGGQVIAQLARLGHRQLVFHRGTQPLPDLPSAIALVGERKNLSAHADAFRHFDPQVVIDVIGYSRHDARELVATLKGTKARVVVLSSVDVYRNRTGFFGLTDAPPDPLPLLEDSPLRTRFHPYADHAMPFDPETTYEKIHVEDTVRAELPGRVTVLRLAAVYGPGDRQHRLWPYLKRMLDQRSFILVERTQANWRWTRGYVENIAAAIVASTVHGSVRSEIYNVGEPTMPTELEWIARIAAATGWQGRIVTQANASLPAHLRTTFNWNYGFGMSCQKLRSALGFNEPVALDLAMHRTIAWESANPPAPDPKMFNYSAEDAAARTLP